MKNQKDEKDDNDTKFLGWCNYCKDPIFIDEDYIKKNTHLYHLECWKQKNDIVEELRFDE